MLTALALLLAGEVAGFDPARVLTPDDLLAYAATPYDRAHAPLGRHALGLLNDRPVVVDFRCSDVCPTYTVRIIHLPGLDGAACATAGGVLRQVSVPSGLSARLESFCVPKILDDHRSEVVR